MSSATIEDAALEYHRRGWKPVPTSRKTKKALGGAWQKAPFDPHQFSGNSQNVALQFGAVSGGLLRCRSRRDDRGRPRRQVPAGDRGDLRAQVQARVAPTLC